MDSAPELRMSVPLVVFPNGTVLVEPSPAQVRATLNDGSLGLLIPEASTR